MSIATSLWKTNEICENKESLIRILKMRGLKAEVKGIQCTMYMFIFIPSLSSVVILNKSHGVQGSFIDFYSLVPHC